ncbi:MAG: hypothetical protein JWP14_2712 [Frankiales bacterium]|nr:hypothetical protein [Frankiales bacterium]
MTVAKAALTWWTSAALVVTGVGAAGYQLVASPSNAATASTSGNGNGNNGNGNGNGGGNGDSSHPIVVTGTVSSKPVPGTPVTLAVKIDNNKNQAINVRTVTAQITSVSSAGATGKPVCSTSWFTLGSFSGSQHINQGATGTVQLPLLLKDLPATNQDNCKGATFNFTFAATADQA